MGIPTLDCNVFLEGEEMINDEALAKVRSVLESNIGEKVKLKGNGGRKKYYTLEAVCIPQVYFIRNLSLFWLIVKYLEGK